MALKRLTLKQIEEALKKTAGNLSQAAKALGVDRKTIYNRINANPALAASLADIREELVDIAESALRRNVINGDNSAIFYTLNNSPEAKRRGWGPRQEITGVDGAPMAAVSVVEIVRPVTAQGLGDGG